MSKFLAVVLCLTAPLSLYAGNKSTSGAGKIAPGSKVYIEQMNGFETYLAAAFTKKKVQLTVVADETQADYVIAGSSDEKKAGWAKIVFYGQDHSDNSASITMIDKNTTAIVFAYAVNKT